MGVGRRSTSTLRNASSWRRRPNSAEAVLRSPRRLPPRLASRWNEQGSSRTSPSPNGARRGVAMLSVSSGGRGERHGARRWRSPPPRATTATTTMTTATTPPTRLAATATGDTPTPRRRWIERWRRVRRECGCSRSPSPPRADGRLAGSGSGGCQPGQSPSWVTPSTTSPTPPPPFHSGWRSDSLDDRRRAASPTAWVASRISPACSWF